MPEIEEQLRRHAEWIGPQMPPLRSPHEIDAVVAPARRNRQPRPSRLAWTAVAAAAAVIVVAGAVAVVSSRSTPPAAAPRPTHPQTVTTGPDAALLPPASLGDLQLWSLTATSAAQPGDTSSSTATTVATANAPGVVSFGDGAFEQLFGEHGEPVVEITARRFLPHETRGLGTMSGRGLQQVSHQVRGLDGRLQSSAFAPGGPAQNTDNHLLPMALLWDEGDYAFTATFRTVSVSQALTFVDALQIGPGGLGAGFLAPSGSELAPLELPSSDAPPTGIVLGTHYATGPDASSEIDVSTCPPGAGCTIRYADVWMWGTRLADGSVEGAVSNYGAPPNSYERIWPDGQDVAVSAYASEVLDLDLARHIADQVALGDRSQVLALQAQVNDRLLALPRVAAAAFEQGAVEVHAAGRLTAVCVALAGQPMACPSATYSDSATPPTGGFSASVLSDGHWFVAAATKGSTPFGFYPDTPDIGAGVLPHPIVGHSAQGVPASAGWELGLIQVPDGLDNIVVTQSGSGSIGGAGVSRPTS